MIINITPYLFDFNKIVSLGTEIIEFFQKDEEK